MKRTLQLLLLLLIGVVMSSNVNAQSFYIHVNTGYANPFSTQNIYNDDLDIWFTSGQSGNNSRTVEAEFVSLGKGINFGGAFGIMFSDYVGLELGVSYLLGMKSKAEWTFPGGSSEETLQAAMVRFIPVVVITPGLEKVNPYAKFGFVFGMGSIIYEYDETDDGDAYHMKGKFNGGLAFGLNSAVGVKFQFTDVLGLFVEINMVNMSYAPGKGEITEATYNGVDLLPDMTTSEKEVEFVKELTYNYEVEPPDSEPYQTLKYKIPFGSVGGQVGLIFTLGGK